MQKSFRKKLLTFVRLLENDTYRICYPLGVRLLNRLCLGFSRLREHKFRHNFADTLNPLRSCSVALFLCSTYHFVQLL